MKIADGAVTSAKVDESVWRTGNVRLTFANAATPGWILYTNGLTIGNAASGAAYANANAEALATLFYGDYTDSTAPLLTSGGSATTRAAQTDAATAWAAGCRFSLPPGPGRVFGIAGNGTGLTSRSLGETAGNETVVFVQDNLPDINLTGDAHHHGVQAENFESVNPQSGADAHVVASGNTSSIDTAGENVNVPLGGSNYPFSVVQPTLFINAEIKL